MTNAPSPPPDTILSVEDLSVGFMTQGRAVQVVKGVSFEVGRGETLAIVGESGSGKSTTGLAVMGLIDPVPGVSVSGAIRLKRKDGTYCDTLSLTDRTLRKIRGNDVAMIFQEPMSSLNPVYTVGAQIVEAIAQHERLGARASKRKAYDMLAELGIPNPEQCLSSYPHQLSGGMRQRVMIAIALSGNPSLLIADEPTTALDVTIQAQILELLQRIQRRTGMSIIFITHNLGVVAEIAQRAIVMYAGQVTESLPITALFSRARMPYTMALLRSVPRLGRERGSKLAAIPGVAPAVSVLPPGCTFHPRCQHHVAGQCDVERPALELVGIGHMVRCHRWREL